MKLRTRLLTTGVGCALLALCGARTAFAQDATQATTIAPIIVTATKRAENLQDVPISITALNSVQLEKYNPHSLSDISDSIPSLEIYPSPVNVTIEIRGFGSAPTNFAFDQDVSIYEDGIYGGRSRQFMAPLFDIDRVEVLRGPQGALLGKNTAAGAINVITAGPTSTFQAQASETYDFDRPGLDFAGDVSGPLTSTLSGRLALKFTDIDGYLPNLATGHSDPREKDQLGRLSLKWEPTANFDATTKLTYSDTLVLGEPTVAVSPTVTQQPPDTRDSVTKFGIPERDDEIAYNSATTANWRFGGGYTLTSITGYSSFDDTKGFDGSVNTNPQEYVETAGEQFKQYSEELQLVSPTSRRFEWIVGAYYDNSTDHISTFQEYNLFGILSGEETQPFSQQAWTASVFGMGTYHILDNLRAQVSLRYTHNDKQGEYQNLADFGYQLDPPGPLIRGSISEDHIDPSITVQYDVRPGAMVYVSVDRGSKGGGFVSDTGTTTDSTFAFKAEQSTNYELGTKTSWLDGHLTADVDVYYLQFANLQVSEYQPTTLGFLTLNAASAHSDGVEAAVKWIPVHDLTLSGSAAYLDARYDNFPGGGCLVSEGPNCTPATNNLRGLFFPYNSKWTGNVNVDYSIPITDGLRVNTSLAANYRSTYAISTDGSPIYGIQSGFVKLNGRVELADAKGHWGIAFVAKNFTNQRVAANAYLWPLSVPEQAVKFMEEPRTLSIEVHARF